MEKYIYILVAVIWFISGIYKAVKKGRKPPAPGEKPGRKKSVLETKLDEILREAQQRKTIPHPVPDRPVGKPYRSEKPVSQELIVDEAAMSSENMFTEDISMETLQPLKSTVSQSQDVPETIQAESGKMTWNFFGSDLKSIVVFNEILGKPKALLS